MSIPSEFLRRAATALLAAARDATPGPWTLWDRGVGWEIKELPEVHDGTTFRREDAEYVALIHPPVAAVLAAWLDDAADHISSWIGAEETMIGDPNYVLIPDTNLPLALAAAILREEVPS